MTNLNFKKWLIAASMAAGMATGASAATLTGESSGVFTSEDAVDTCTETGLFAGLACLLGSDPDGFEGATASGPTIIWPGDATGDEDGDPARSSLTIEDTNFNVSPVPIGTADYLVGELTWFNAASPGGLTPDTFSADATINLLFSSPNGDSGSQDVTFNITNTVNTAGDTVGLSLGAFDFGFVPTPFSLGGGLTLNGFSTGLTSCSSANPLLDCTLNGSDWFLAENQTSTLGIYANISAVAPIPLPAAGWLMIAGLGGLAALRRLRKAA